MKNKFVLLIVSYILIAITFLLTLNLNKIITNSYLIPLIIPMPLLILIYFFIMPKTHPSPNSKKFIIRYTMLCKNCNWEWMSHTSEKKPTQCPNCKDRNKLEIIGWRKITLPKKKSEQDLKKFL